MGIGGVKAMDGIAGRPGAAVRPADFASKNIQDEISSVQRQKQGLSSKQEMPAEEKAKKRQELQQELSSLYTQLRQRQAEARKEQQKEEVRREVLREGARPADGGVKDAERAGNKAEIEKAEKNKANSEIGEEKNINAESPEKEAVSKGIQAEGKEDAARADEKDTKLEDIGIPMQQMKAIVEKDSFREQTKRREAVIARMESGIVILKGEIRQDELRGADADKKKAELKKQEQKVQRAASGIPDIKGPSKAAAAQVKAADERDRVRADTVRRSRDGIVIMTPNVLTNNIW